MKTTIELPLLPLRDVVVYPHMVIPLFVGREKSIEALEQAMVGDKQILLVAQRNPADDDPDEAALYRVGTVATVLQLLKLPDGTVKVLVEGEHRGRIEAFVERSGHVAATVELVDEAPCPEREAEVFVRSLMSQFEQYVQLGKKVPAEVLSSLAAIDEPSRLVDTMAAHMALKIEQKQDILEIIELDSRIEPGVEEIDQEVHQDDEAGGDDQDAQQQRQVALDDRLDREPTEARHRKDALDDDAAAEKRSTLQPQHGHHREERVARHVAENEAAARNALRPRGADEVAAPGLDHAGADEPKVGGCVDEPQGEGRQHEMSRRIEEPGQAAIAGTDRFDAR